MSSAWMAKRHQISRASLGRRGDQLALDSAGLRISETLIDAEGVGFARRSHRSRAIGLVADQQKRRTLAGCTGDRSDEALFEDVLRHRISIDG